MLHMVSPPGGPHHRFGSHFGPVADRRELSERGVEGAELVVEFRLLRDETYKKFDFYEACRVRELLVLPPAGRHIELF